MTNEVEDEDFSPEMIAMWKEQVAERRKELFGNKLRPVKPGLPLKREYDRSVFEEKR